MANDYQSLRYPIGKFKGSTSYSSEQVVTFIETIADLPNQLRKVFDQASDADWNTPYRPGGWTIRQLMHHIADSHMNALIRFKWALSEDNPLIKAYDEQAWSELVDYEADPEISLQLIEAIHRRWEFLLQNLSEQDWKKTLVHPEKGQKYDLKLLLAHYDWHSKHHLAHFRQVIN
jgi:hypothetical protein